MSATDGSPYSPEQWLWELKRGNRCAFRGKTPPAAVTWPFHEYPLPLHHTCRSQPVSQGGIRLRYVQAAGRGQFWSSISTPIHHVFTLALLTGQFSQLTRLKLAI